MMKHIFNNGRVSCRPTLLLLHGTGGDEQNLLPVASIIDDTAAVLSVRGNVSESGMPRFFRHRAEGVFDEEDLIFRTQELHDFLDDAANQYGFDRDNMIAIGYSNGANIAASLLYHHQNTLAGAVLFHPMVPRRGMTLPDLTDIPVFIGAGTHDPIRKPEETEELAAQLEGTGANTETHWESTSHQLTRNEMSQAVSWYENLIRTDE